MQPSKIASIDDAFLPTPEQISGGSSPRPNSSVSASSDLEEPDTEVDIVSLQIDSDRRFEERIQQVKLFVAAELKRLRRQQRSIALSTEMQRAVNVLSTVPECSVKKRLFRLRLLNVALPAGN
jgi:hypothetical protein